MFSGRKTPKIKLDYIAILEIIIVVIINALTLISQLLFHCH